MKVLIIEDNPIEQLKLKHFAKEIGYECTVAGSVQEGKAMLQPDSDKVPFDIIISDVQLSDGIVFEITDWPDIPTVFISAYEEEDYLESALQINRSIFLNKPFTDLTLKAAIIRLTEESVKTVTDENFITVFGRHKNPIQIRLNQIIYIESEGNYATVFTTNGEKHTVKRSAKFLVDQLGDEHFVQIQRSIYVYRPKISNVILPSNEVIVGGKHILVVSKKYKKNIYEFATLARG